ncbi:DNA polymerase II subunit B4 [Malania oleifera]|uniref:DNA polymerase II subunit B4 n=1 Tax=Malania oleifera TaxID=397392 RepID=UPI0025AE1D5E|nr:DNA polymerase II subunit B4 [Malania oleifera]
MAKVVGEAEELPKAVVRRVVKGKLCQLSSSGEGDISLNKDALLAFSESARIFIHYISATANDICKESKRQTINADDVLKALEEIEFPEFVHPLRASLDDFRRKYAGKRSGAAKAKEAKKKKLEEPLVENGQIEGKQDDGDEENEDEDETNGND